MLPFYSQMPMSQYGYAENFNYVGHKEDVKTSVPKEIKNAEKKDPHKNNEQPHQKHAREKNEKAQKEHKEKQAQQNKEQKEKQKHSLAQTASYSSAEMMQMQPPMMAQWGEIQ